VKLPRHLFWLLRFLGSREENFWKEKGRGRDLFSFSPRAPAPIRKKPRKREEGSLRLFSAGLSAVSSVTDEKGGRGKNAKEKEASSSFLSFTGRSDVTEKRGGEGKRKGKVDPTRSLENVSRGCRQGWEGKDASPSASQVCVDQAEEEGRKKKAAEKKEKTHRHPSSGSTPRERKKKKTM